MELGCCGPLLCEGPPFVLVGWPAGDACVAWWVVVPFESQAHLRNGPFRQVCARENPPSRRLDVPPAEIPDRVFSQARDDEHGGPKVPSPWLERSGLYAAALGQELILLDQVAGRDVSARA